MKRWVLAAITAVMFATVTIGAVAAHERAEGGLNRERGITEAATHKVDRAESGTVTLTDLIVTGRPRDAGGDN